MFSKVWVAVAAILNWGDTKPNQQPVSCKALNKCTTLTGKICMFLSESFVSERWRSEANAVRVCVWISVCFTEVSAAGRRLLDTPHFIFHLSCQATISSLTIPLTSVRSLMPLMGPHHACSLELNNSATWSCGRWCWWGVSQVSRVFSSVSRFLEKQKTFFGWCTLKNRHSVWSCSHVFPNTFSSNFRYRTVFLLSFPRQTNEFVLLSESSLLSFIQDAILLKVAP